MSKIKLGVTLFSFTNEYYYGKYTLEDCIRVASETGAEQFEIVGTQMLRGYPYVSEEFRKRFQDICEKYNITCNSYGANMDRGVRADRNLSEDEMLVSTINDIKTAYRLGASNMRAQFLLSPKVMARLAPYAEEYGVRVGIEIHNPETPSTPIMQEYFEIYEKTGSKYIGFVPDFGEFATRPNITVKLALEKGADPKAMEHAIKAQYEKRPAGEVRKELMDMGADTMTLQCFEEMNGFLTFYKEPDLEGLKRILPYCIYFHGKFHYVHEDLHEESIPYEQILPIIEESLFEGSIISEFEGAAGDSREMVRRHIAMERKILGEG